MYRPTKNIRFITILAALLMMLGCAQPLKETRLTAEDPQFTLLIAGDASEFKDSLRPKVVGHYQDQSNIDVINIKKLKQVNPSDYDVILIMDTCLAWTGFNPSLKAFLSDLQDTHHVVVFMTAGDPDWEYSFKDIDAITSASRTENVQAAFVEIIHRIDHIVTGI